MAQTPARRRTSACADRDVGLALDGPEQPLRRRGTAARAGTAEGVQVHGLAQGLDELLAATQVVGNTQEHPVPLAAEHQLIIKVSELDATQPSELGPLLGRERPATSDPVGVDLDALEELPQRQKGRKQETHRERGEEQHEG